MCVKTKNPRQRFNRGPGEKALTRKEKEKKKKMDKTIFQLPELPAFPFPSSEEVESRIETFIEKAVARPVAKIVSKTVITPLMVLEKITSGMRDASKGLAKEKVAKIEAEDEAVPMEVEEKVKEK